MFLVSLSVSAKAQLDINEKKEPQLIGEIKVAGHYLMSASLIEEENVVLFMFKNLQFQQIEDIQSFSIAYKDSEELYSIISDNLNNKAKKELEINLANGDKLTLNFKGNTVQFLLWDGVSSSFSQYFKQKQIDKLFGKAI